MLATASEAPPGMKRPNRLSWPINPTATGLDRCGCGDSLRRELSLVLGCRNGERNREGAACDPGKLRVEAQSFRSRFQELLHAGGAASASTGEPALSSGTMACIASAALELCGREKSHSDVRPLLGFSQWTGAIERETSAGWLNRGHG